MPPAAPIDADEVHVLDAGPGKGARRGLALTLVALAVVTALGAWIALTDPFASEASRAPPAPAPDNLIGPGWSFETTTDSSPEQLWMTPGEAPGGFAFSTEAAVSGASAAQALPNEAGWSRMVSRETWRVDGRDQQVQLSAVSSGAGVQLLALFESSGGASIETVVASGSGALVGRATPPPGFGRVRFGVGCVGAGSVDDVSLRLVPRQTADDPGPVPRKIGVFDILVGDPLGVTLFRGQDLLLRLEPLSLRSADGRTLPGAAAQLPGQQSLAYADGSTVSVISSVSEEAQGLVITQHLKGLAEGTRLVRQGVVSGSLASSAVGVRSSRGFESFVDDFELKGVDALVLGRTQDRLGFEADQPFDLQVSHRADGTVALVIECSAQGDVSQEITIQASFRDERVLAAGLADEAREAEQQGHLGVALARLQQIIDQYPYDEQVLAGARSDRGRLAADMQSRLSALRAELEDALFLGSAQRCEEVRDKAVALAATYASSSGEAPFLSLAGDVDVAGARLIGEANARRRGRLEALLRSFEEHGGYPSVCEELRAELERSPSGLSAPLTSDVEDSR